ncbi:MAG: RDD family protein [Zoogloea sp.]|uniref:RDD family protein n=1 Tax=Zoogloea sp. TaxID=49181 RepID=UPI00260C0535|nr:RDD family protein [Zoogloea sp.]MDD2990425.1 RDD family protein [Zoogloea sp.]
MPSKANANGGLSARRQTVELAGLRRRLASMLYESLLLLGVLALTFMVPLLVLGIGTDYTPRGGVLWIYIFAVLGMYFLWYWRRGGQTLAMQTWKLRIVNSDGKPVSLRQGWIRYALAWPSVLFFGAGVIWALIDKDRQFLHDRLAGTRIVLLPASTLA